MLAVRGYYDGEAFQPLEDITLRKNQQVIITILDNTIEIPKKNDAERIRKVKEMRGSLHQYATANTEEENRAAIENTKNGFFSKAKQQDVINERLRIAESLYGIIPPDITLEESREERLSKI